MVPVSAPPSVAGTIATGRYRAGLVIGIGIAAALGAGLLVANLAIAGHIAIASVFLWFLLPLIAWRLPAGGVLLMAATALVIEQFPLGLADRLTELIPLFKSLSAGTGLSGVYVNPAELMMVTIIVTWLVKSSSEGTLGLPRTQLAAAMAVMLGVVAIGEVHGLATGGDYKTSLWEVRSWAYLVVMYFLAAELTRKRHLVWGLLWVLAICDALKGVQGSYRYFAVRNVFPKPETLLEHEEAVFFGLAILLTMALWLFGMKGRLRTVATATLPLVVFANLANNRRTAWIILGAGVAILLVLAWLRFPARRKRINVLAITILVVAAGYLPIFWNSHSVLAEPAQAVKSAVSPDERDASSDLYRVIENINLGIAIRQTTPFGYGFGKELPNTLKLPDLTKTDPFILFIPHNQILWLWLRMGAAGALAFWFMIGASVVAACQLARSRDPQFAVVGAVAVCAMAAYVIEAWYDQGLTSFRVAILTGCILGTVEAAKRLDRDAALARERAGVPDEAVAEPRKAA